MSLTSTYGTSLVKAHAILSFLAQQDRPQNVTEIGIATQMSKSTAFKLLETLQVLGLVEKDPYDPVYQIGSGIVRLARSYLSDGNPIVRLAEPQLKRLNQQTGETIHLGVLQGNSVIYLSKLESPKIVRMHSSVGSTSPLYCTGLGKALLATFRIDELNKYLTETELTPYTPHTITDVRLLMQELEDIRKVGYAIDNGEHETDVRCVSMAIQGRHKVYGAISISAPRYRITDDLINQYSSLLGESRKEIVSLVEV